jgi:outer membrane protein TolC
MPEDYLPGLKPLLKEAVERSPTTISASIAVAQGEAGRYLNAAGLWPQLSLDGSYQVSKDAQTNGGSSTSKGFYYGASISQAIFQWGALKNSATIGNLAAKVAERNFAEAYRLLAISIREQYMGLIGKKIALRNARFALKQVDEALQVAQAKFDAGNSSQADLGAYKLNKEQAQLDADRSAEDFASTKQVFVRLVGADRLDDDSIPIVLPHPEFSEAKADAILAGFVGEGIESTFQNQVFQMLLKEQDLTYSIAKVRLLPKVSASAAFSYSNQIAIQGATVEQVGVESESVVIAANWAIFDGFATKGSKLSALASKRSYERARQSYIDSTVDQVSDMRHQLGFSSRAMAISEIHNSLIDAEVKRLGQDKDLGYASQATIDSGITNLYATEYNMTYARADFFSRWTEFVSIAGVDPALANVSSRYVR